MPCAAPRTVRSVRLFRLASGDVVNASFASSECAAAARSYRRVVPPSVSPQRAALTNGRTRAFQTQPNDCLFVIY